MAWLVGTPRERAGRAERGRRPTGGLGGQNADAESKHISPSLSLSCITRVAPHCVNTLMILHVAHSKFFTPEGGGRR